MMLQANTKQHPMLLTESQAAAALGISPRTLWELNRQGKVPCVRLTSGVKRYRVDTLNRVLAELEATQQTA